MAIDVSSIDFTAINYQDPSELKKHLGLSILSKMTPAITSPQEPNGVGAITAFSRGVAWTADYIAKNLPLGVVWDPNAEEFVPFQTDAPPELATPARRRGRPKRVVSDDLDPMVIEKPMRTPTPIAPPVLVPRVEAEHSDDVNEILSRLEAVAAENDQLLHAVLQQTSLLKAQAEQMHFLQSGLLISLRLTHALLMNALGNDETLSASTLQEAIEALGE